MIARVFTDRVIAVACIRATDHLCSIIIMICPTILLYYTYREIMWENTTKAACISNDKGRVI